MSGIFDKYLDYINGSNKISSKTNTNRNVVTISSTEMYIPYKKNRRSSSTTSNMSDTDVAAFDALRKASVGSVNSDMSDTSPIVVKKEVKKVVNAPNNRVNF